MVLELSRKVLCTTILVGNKAAKMNFYYKRKKAAEYSAAFLRL